jgi:hypothetical protein
MGSSRVRLPPPASDSLCLGHCSCIQCRRGGDKIACFTSTSEAELTNMVCQGAGEQGIPRYKERLCRAVTDAWDARRPRALRQRHCAGVAFSVYQSCRASPPDPNRAHSTRPKNLVATVCWAGSQNLLAGYSDPSVGISLDFLFLLFNSAGPGSWDCRSDFRSAPSRRYPRHRTPQETLGATIHSPTTSLGRSRSWTSSGGRSGLTAPYRNRRASAR